MTFPTEEALPEYVARIRRRRANWTEESFEMCLLAPAKSDGVRLRPPLTRGGEAPAHPLDLEGGTPPRSRR